MYVVVDANVSVKLTITFTVPDDLTIPCLTQLFKPYKYFVGDECDKILAATEELVDQQTLATVLRPTNKYIKLSEMMINYLISKGVTITIFNDGTGQPLQIEKIYPIVPFIVIAQGFYGSIYSFHYQTNTTGLLLTSNGGQTFNFDRDVYKFIRTSFTLTVTTPPLANSEPSYVSKFVVEIGWIFAGRWQYIDNRNTPSFVSVGPNTTRSEFITIFTSSDTSNIGVRVHETRFYNSTPPPQIVLAQSTVVATNFTILVSD